jgi:hypothetical protein
MKRNYASPSGEYRTPELREMIAAMRVESEAQSRAGREHAASLLAEAAYVIAALSGAAHTTQDIRRRVSS